MALRVVVDSSSDIPVKFREDFEIVRMQVSFDGSHIPKG
jgi:fatty acid-binding protein DegV